jgi:hypothetical protein
MPRYVDGVELLNENVTTNLGRKSLDLATAGCGAVPAAVAATCVATEYGDESFHKTVLTCTALPLSLADVAGTTQHGGVQVYTMPKGAIISLGASVKGNLTLGVTGTFIDAFTGVNSLGTVVCAGDATLTSTEANWLQSTANATAASKVAAITSFSVATALTESPGRVVNGTSTAAPVFLNFAIADDATHTAGTGTFTGTITIAWVNVGGN